mgnify:CR=1 FL=1
MIARKRFGQHFLHDAGVLGRIVEAVDPRPGDEVLEIGPGEGALTRPLLQRLPRLLNEPDLRSMGAAMARKFVHHTGIEARGVSAHDEVTMAKAAVESLQRRTACDLRDCRGVVFVSPSFVPLEVANKYLAGPDARRERLGRAARQLTRKLGIPACPSYGVNWFCSGYARALAAVRRRFVFESTLEPNEFVLVVEIGRAHV